MVQILFNEWLEEIFKIGQKNFVKLPETFSNLLLFLRFWERKHYSVYRGLKVNVHNTLKRCPECLLNVSCSFSLRCVFRGTTLILIFDGSLKYKASNNLLENTFMKSAYKKYINWYQSWKQIFILKSFSLLSFQKNMIWAQSCRKNNKGI